RLVEADMRDRRVRIDRPPALEGELLLEILGPAERPAPALLADQRPAVGQPQRRLLVSALRYELTVLAVRDEPVAERVILQEHPVTGSFVVEAKRLAGGADLEHTAGAGDEGERGRRGPIVCAARGRRLGRRAVSRAER